MVYFLLEACNNNAFAALRSGHRDLRSINRYRKFQGEMGRNRQTDLFSEVTGN